MEQSVDSERGHWHWFDKERVCCWQIPLGKNCLLSQSPDPLQRSAGSSLLQMYKVLQTQMCVLCRSFVLCSLMPVFHQFEVKDFGF